MGKNKCAFPVERRPPSRLLNPPARLILKRRVQPRRKVGVPHFSRTLREVGRHIRQRKPRLWVAQRFSAAINDTALKGRGFSRAASFGHSELFAAAPAARTARNLLYPSANCLRSFI